MKNVFLGEYIKQRRLDLGLTQEQLCDGICEPMTLSRLENGKQTPSRNRINALLQRLGLPDDRYFALKYVRKHFEETITSVGILPMVYFNYARVLDLCGRYEDSAECAEEGRKACLKYGHYQYLPHCLEIQAECAHFMGDDKKSADLYRKCYYLCQVIEYQEGLEITKKEAKEYLGMEFET